MCLGERKTTGTTSVVVCLPINHSMMVSISEVPT